MPAQSSEAMGRGPERLLVYFGQDGSAPSAIVFEVLTEEQWGSDRDTSRLHIWQVKTWFEQARIR